MHADAVHANLRDKVITIVTLPKKKSNYNRESSCSTKAQFSQLNRYVGLWRLLRLKISKQATIAHAKARPPLLFLCLSMPC